MKMLPVDCSTMSIDDLEKEIQSLCFTRGVSKPIGIYLVGRDDDRRNEKIVQWVFGSILVQGLYSRGVNESINKILKKHSWSLFAASTEIPCSRPSDKLDEKKEIIVTIKQNKPGFEIVDGFHRALAMIREGRTQILSFIGLHEEDSLKG